MHIFFEIMKGFFFFVTIFVGIVFLRGENIFGANYAIIIQQTIMPGYLVLCGIMFGYILAHIQNNQNTNKTYTKSFIIGITLGLILALGYILL